MMKKIVYVLMTLFSLLVIITGTVFAAPLKDGQLNLREVRNDSSGGVIFIFDVAGEFNKQELKKGTVFFGDEKYDLNCKLEDNVLTCTTSRKTAGQYVNVNIDGFVFYARVPETPNTQKSTQPYCYPVLDLNEGPNGNVWNEIDEHCQNASASNGEIIIHHSSFAGGNSNFIFSDEINNGLCAPVSSVDAYYVQFGC
jgi:hypothetical protein